MIKVGKFCLFFFLTIAGITLLGCSGDDSSSNSDDTGATGTSFSIVSATPGNGDVGVARDISVTATFDSSMNESTLTSETFTVSGNNGSISGAVSYSEEDKTVTFQPDSPLDYGTVYKATVSTAVANNEGNTLESDYSWSFTTEYHAIYGSYWGKITVSETEYDMCLTVQEDKITISSTRMSKEYTNIAYTEEGGTQSFVAYADEDTGQTGDALCSGTFALTNNIKTCVADVTMDTSTITTGTLWCVTVNDLYGSYWGSMTVGVVDYDMCLDVRSGYVCLLSAAMSFRYTNVVYSQDTTDGTWSFTTYYYDDYDHENAKVTGTFYIDDDGDITCIGEVVPMSTITNTLTLGDDYDYEIGYGDFMDPIDK